MKAAFLDGRTADVQTVTLDPRGTALVISGAQGEIGRWAWDRLRARPLGQSRDGLTLGLAGDHPARLMVADPALIAIIRDKASQLQARETAPGLARAVIWASTAIAIVVLSSTLLLSGLSRGLATIMPLSYETAIADIPFDQWLIDLGTAKGGEVRLCDAPNGVAALEKITAPLLAAADLPYDIEFFVTDFPGANAGAFPGGRILIYEGIFAVADEPRLFAALMAHELGHVHYRHMIATSLRQAALNGMPNLIAGSVPGGEVVSDFMQELNRADFSRAMEREADAYAHRLLAEVGLSPASLADYFANSKLRALDQAGVLSYLNSHPFHQDRIDSAERAASDGQDFQNPTLLDDTEWDALTSICQHGNGS
ncbi:MAG: M48 family metallopeptidase [Pseudomonadota bacterium]